MVNYGNAMCYEFVLQRSQEFPNKKITVDSNSYSSIDIGTCNWKAPHKKKASDKICSICMYYCIKRAEIVHTKTRQMSFALFLCGRFRALYALCNNNACKQNKVSVIASLMRKLYKLCHLPFFLWSIPTILFL